MAPFLLFAAAATAAGVPRPSPLKVYQDWIVACDNGRACHAVALMPQSGEGATMAVRRGPEASAPIVIDFTLDGVGAAGVAADGRKLPVRITADDNGAKVAAADAPAVIA